MELSGNAAFPFPPCTATRLAPSDVDKEHFDTKTCLPLNSGILSLRIQYKQSPE